MLRFFRKNGVYVGAAIVFFFAATMFSGVLFFGGVSPPKTETQLVSSESAIGFVGDLPLSKRKFLTVLNNRVSQFQTQNPTTGISPELAEALQLSALNQIVNQTLLLAGAEKQNLKITKQELNFALLDVYDQYNLEGKKQLKQLLKNSGITFKQFKASLENDLKSQKMTQVLRSQVVVTNQDVQNLFKEVKARHLLIKPKVGEGMDSQVANEAALLKIEEILAEINGGMAFSTAAKKYSEDPNTSAKGGDFGVWIKAGTTLKEIEDVVYSLSKGEISRPVQTFFGYHLVIVDKIKLIKTPK